MLGTEKAQGRDGETQREKYMSEVTYKWTDGCMDGQEIHIEVLPSLKAQSEMGTPIVNFHC